MEPTDEAAEQISNLIELTGAGWRPVKKRVCRPHALRSASKGDLMASKTVTIDRKLWKSEVYRGLSGKQKNVLHDFLMKRTLKKMPSGKWEISNNGDIVYPYTEAESKGMGRSTFMKCLDALIKKGFIDVYHSGNGGKKGDVSLYWISDRWEKWGTDKFVKKQRPKDHRCLRGFAAHPERRRKNISTQKCNRNITPQ